MLSTRRGCDCEIFANLRLTFVWSSCQDLTRLQVTASSGGWGCGAPPGSSPCTSSHTSSTSSAAACSSPVSSRRSRLILRWGTASFLEIKNPPHENINESHHAPQQTGLRNHLYSFFCCRGKCLNFVQFLSLFLPNVLRWNYLQEIT